MTRCKILAPAALLALAACASGSPPPPTINPPAPTPPIAADASPYGLYLAGRAARDTGHLHAAAAFLARAAEDEGEPSYLKADAFHAALESGDISGAIALAPSGEGASAGDLRLAALVRGVEALSDGDDKGAYQTLSGPDQGFPYRSAALLVAPFAAAGAGDAADALALPALSGDPIGQFVGDLDQCELFERLGRTQQAETGYKTLMERGDAGGIVAAAYGAFLERHGRATDAATVYKTALARDPDDVVLLAAARRVRDRDRAPALPSVRQAAAAALIFPAAALATQRQTELALIELRLALRLDPGDDEAWVLVGDIMAAGDIDAARAAYRQVGPGSVRYAAARSKLALSYAAAGDRTEALKLARETAAQVPSSRDAQVTLANLLRDDHQYAESAAVLTRLIDANAARPDWRLYYLRASTYDEAGDAEKTEADLQQALKLDPDEPELLNFQGYFWVDRGEHLKEALAMVQRAVDAEPQSGAMVDSLGWAYYRLGDYKAAVANLENAVTLDPSIPEVNDHLGDAYWRVGRKTEAEFQWRHVLSLDPDAKLKARAEAKLASPQGPDAPAAPAATPAGGLKTP